MKKDTDAGGMMSLRESISEGTAEGKTEDRNDSCTAGFE